MLRQKIQMPWHIGAYATLWFWVGWQSQEAALAQEEREEDEEEEEEEALELGRRG